MILRKSGTYEINSGHLYKKGDCPGKHGTNGNTNLVTSLKIAVSISNDVNGCFSIYVIFPAALRLYGRPPRPVTRAALLFALLDRLQRTILVSVFAILYF
jgi:hypothetical protein